MGCDLEFIEPRERSLFTDYFTRREMERVDRAASHACDELITAIWSAKEAALKALQLGLSVDTRAVNCLIDWERGGKTGVGDGWMPFEIEIEAERLGRAVDPLQGWWRALDGFVLTLASSARPGDAPFDHQATIVSQTL